MSPDLVQHLEAAARPIVIDLGGGNRVWSRGLSKREEFAKAVLQAQAATLTARGMPSWEERRDIVQTCVMLADDLLAELERTAKP